MKTQHNFLALALSVILFVPAALAQAPANDYAPSVAPQAGAASTPPPVVGDSANSVMRHGGHKGRGKRGAGGKGNGKNHARLVARFDTNGDGVLDPTEKAAAKAFVQQRRAMRGQGAGGGQAMGGAGRHGGGQSGAHHQAMMQKFDANGDGTLDATEKAQAKAFRQQHRQLKQNMAGNGTNP